MANYFDIRGWPARIAALTIGALTVSAAIVASGSFTLSQQPSGRIPYTESNGVVTTTPNLAYNSSTQTLTVAHCTGCSTSLNGPNQVMFSDSANVASSTAGFTFTTSTKQLLVGSVSTTNPNGFGAVTSTIFNGMGGSAALATFNGCGVGQCGNGMTFTAGGFTQFSSLGIIRALFGSGSLFMTNGTYIENSAGSIGTPSYTFNGDNSKGLGSFGTGAMFAAVGDGLTGTLAQIWATTSTSFFQNILPGISGSSTIGSTAFPWGGLTLGTGGGNELNCIGSNNCNIAASGGGSLFLGNDTALGSTLIYSNNLSGAAQLYLTPNGDIAYRPGGAGLNTMYMASTSTNLYQPIYTSTTAGSSNSAINVSGTVAIAGGYGASSPVALNITNTNSASNGISVVGNTAYEYSCTGSAGCDFLSNSSNLNLGSGSTFQTGLYSNGSETVQQLVLRKDGEVLLRPGTSGVISVDLSPTSTSFSQPIQASTTAGSVTDMESVSGTIKWFANAGTAPLTSVGTGTSTFAGPVSTTKMAISNLTQNPVTSAFMCITAQGFVEQETANCTVSSIRFKEHIDSLKPADLLAETLKLRSVQFDYTKDNGSVGLLNTPTDQGFLAEEVARIDPYLVGWETTDANSADLAKVKALYPDVPRFENGKWYIPHTVAYDKLSVLFAGAIQAEDALRIADQKAEDVRITALENRMGIVERLINWLRSLFKHT